MAPGHQHAPVAEERPAASHRRRLLIAFVLIAGYFLVELVGAFLTNSLALLADAGHMFTDVLGIGMALAAIQVASGPRGDDPQRSFGLYRLEILAALANAVLLFGVAGFILYESVRRLGDPPEIQGLPMLVIGTVGLVVNLIAFALLRGGAKASLNLEGAYLEVLADTLGSVGVVVAAIVTQTTGNALVDPVFGLAIGLFVVPRTWRLARKALRVLIQAAPPDVDVAVLEEELGRLHGVASVHDLHVWTLTSGMDVGSVHLRMEPGHDPHAVLHRARSLLRSRHGIAHATVQVEPADHRGACDDCAETCW